MDLTWGDIVVCVAPGDYGKPRPAVVVQAGLFNETHASVTLCPITSSLVAAPLFRLALKPNKHNGLQVNSQIMVDKIVSLPKTKIHQKLGALTFEQKDKLSEALRLWLGL